MTATAMIRHRPHVTPAGERTDNSASSRLRTAACLATIAILVFGPLAFGAVEPWSMFVLHIGAVVVFALWLFSVMLGPIPCVKFRLVHLPPMLFAGIVIWQIFTAQSAYRHETVTGFLNYIAYGLIFLIASDLFRNEREVRSLCLSLAVLGFALAVIGSVQEFTSDGKLYWLRTPRDTGAIFGPYVNRNHYAGVIELLFPFALMGSLKSNLEPSKRILLGFSAALMIASVFLSGSRGGLVSIGFQVVFLLVLLLWRSRRLGLVLALTLVFIVTGAFGTWLGSDRLIGRIVDLKTGNEMGRLEMATDGIRMFEAKPWTGWGLGTFPIVYPKFRSFATDLYVNEAHNDFVQILAETGILGLLAGLALIGIVFRRGLQQVERADYRSWRTLAVAASLVGVVGICVHSLFDFNLQIPANAMLFYVLCAIAGSSSEQDPEVVQMIERGNIHTLVEVQP